jgi:elongation factor P
MINSQDIKNGTCIRLDGKLYFCVDFLHVKPGKGAAFVRTKIRNVISGAVVEKTFNPTDKFPTAFIERKDMEYLYNDGDLYYFMDQESYETVPIDRSKLGDAFRFVKENMVVKILSYKGVIFGSEAPNFVELLVTQTEPGVRGDTATNVTKPATLETGAEIRVPIFINEGERYPYRRVHGARLI